jgi:TrmH RNA methyltransferase
VAYRLVSAEELERASGSRAHQGVCAVLAAPQLPVASLAQLRAWASEPGVWLALDGVGNPHNLGAIARTAAFLGARGLWLDASDAAPVTSAAALRTAEGALETLPVWLMDGLPAGLQAVQQAGGSVAALCLQDAVALGSWQPPRDRAVVLVAGAEEHGVSPAVRRACATAVRIPGSAAVDSLNVGVAVGVALARWLVP